MSSYRDLSSKVVQPISGEVAPFKTGEQPTGWLALDGSTVSQSTYSSLYAQVGLIADGNISTTWTVRTSGTASAIYGLAYGGSTYLYAGVNKAIATSTDAITWTLRSPAYSATEDFQALTYGGGIFVLGTQQGGIATSTDGITWTIRTSGAGANTIYGIAYGASTYVYVGSNERVATSTDAITWTLRSTDFATGETLRSIVYGNGIFVLGTATGGIATSTDGITWTTRTSGTASSINGILYDNSIYLRVGAGGDIATSTDAITWVARASGTTSQLNGVAYAPPYYVAVGGAVAVYSTDAITWSSNPQTGIVARNIIYGGGIYLLCGDAGVLRTATSYTYNPSTQFKLPTATATTDGVSLYVKT